MNERLKQVRIALDMNTREFAEALGISNGAVSLYENGKREINKRIIIIVCDKFKVNETWLLTGEGDMFAPITKEQAVADIANYVLEHPNDIKAAFIKAIYQLDEDRLESAYEFLNDMLLAVKNNMVDEKTQA